MFNSPGLKSLKMWLSIGSLVHPEVVIYEPEAETVCIIQLLQIWLDFVVFYKDKIHRKKLSEKLKEKK
jgi:hypothetical protein